MAQRNQRSSDETDRRLDGDQNWCGDELCDVRDLTTNFDVSRRSMLAATGAGILGGLVSGSGTVAAQDDDRYHRKTRPTIYTEAMRANAQQNVDRYDWAASQRDAAVEGADELLDRYAGDADDPDLDALWSLVTSQKIPRGGGLAYERDILGGFSDPGTDRLWKIETTVDDPHGDGKLTVPTNDFAAYRESGLDDRGMFDPELADDQYLVNEEHPEMGEGWGVDDGWGWIDEDDDLGGGAGNRWNFVAYYNHWFIWRPGGVRRILEALAEAYLLSGETTYAVAGLTILDRIADVYPEMSTHPYRQPAFFNNHGGRQTGRIIGSGWEGNLVRSLLPTYDAFFPALDDREVADEVTAFLDGKTDEYPDLSGKGSVAALRENVEENYIQEILTAAKNSDISPDRGQRPAVAVSARVQDDTRDGGYTREALEWLFQPGGERFTGDQWDEEPENWNTTGGEVLKQVVDNCDRDGYWHESAQLYNRIQMSSIRQVAETLKGYDAFDGADLYQHPKMQQALAINSDLVLLDTLAPQIGDTHAYSGDLWLSASGISDGYEVTGSDEFAQLWHFVNGYSTAGIRGSIFDADPDDLGDEIQAVIDAEGPLDLPSQNLAGYGFAALRDGENYLNRSFGTTYDTSELFADASAGVDDSFDEAIQFEATGEGEWWSFEFDAEEAGEYELEIETLFVSSYGTYELFINGESIDTVDFYAESFTRDTVSFVADLQAGTNEMRWEVVGKNDDSSNYKMALYNLTLFDEEDREIRDGIAEQGNSKRAFWLYYGRTGFGGGGTAHGHLDTLNLGVAAHGMELARDLGYPDQTGTYPPRQFFTENTISHNTVTVDERGQIERWVGTPRHFDGSSDRVNLIDVEASDSYEVTDEYRRTTAMITVDEEHSYAVDFFRVAGGDDHRFSFHGTKATVATEGLDLEAQESGTLAGPDVAFGDDDYDDAMYDDSIERTPGSGLNYFDNVERDDDPAEKVVIDWDVEDQFDVRDDDAEGVHMRLTSFGDFDEVELADGYPPKSSSSAPTEPSIRYAFLNRSGSDLDSTFVSTIEHYEDERAVESVEEVHVEGGDAHALRVELATGRTDYVVCAFDDGGTLTVDDRFQIQGFVGVVSYEDGSDDPTFAYLNDGTLVRPLNGAPLIQRPYGHLTGTVRDFTREMSLENDLDVRLHGHQHDAVDLDDQGATSAEFVYVDADGPAGERSQRANGNGAYPIESIDLVQGNRVRIDVGEKTFTRDFVDPDQLEAGGYNYIVDEDDEVQIPVAETWSAE
ncbi:heparinase II/III domain-containing protein [Halomontanus rarus]|uniref:heparinase II/III domain-containing protein n=1 Tax=Halomontanus rarus TaxID=3034020 RepID=UPI0023E8498B|nr:heparinase II/III family protein [Halovivax sp. TS33]